MNNTDKSYHLPKKQTAYYGFDVKKKKKNSVRA